MLITAGNKAIATSAEPNPEMLWMKTARKIIAATLNCAGMSRISAERL
jgi:hypothetical protein